MPEGNLVIFRGLDTSQDSLLTASHILTSAIFLQLPLLGPSHLLVHANVKWSKILVNSIPLHFPGPEAPVANLSFPSTTTTGLRVVTLSHPCPPVFTCRPLCV